MVGMPCHSYFFDDGGMQMDDFERDELLQRVYRVLGLCSVHELRIIYYFGLHLCHVVGSEVE